MKINIIDLAKAFMNMYKLDYDEALSMVYSNIEASTYILVTSNQVFNFWKKYIEEVKC